MSPCRRLGLEDRRASFGETFESAFVLCQEPGQPGYRGVGPVGTFRNHFRLVTRFPNHK